MKESHCSQSWIRVRSPQGCGIGWLLIYLELQDWKGRRLRILSNAATLKTQWQRKCGRDLGALGFYMPPPPNAIRNVYVLLMSNHANDMSRLLSACEWPGTSQSATAAWLEGRLWPLLTL